MERMMSKYILITFYSTRRDDGKTVWQVYGHAGPGTNERLGEYDDKTQAMEESFRHGVPVMLGRNYESILIKLQDAPP